MDRVTTEKVRPLSLDELGLDRSSAALDPFLGDEEEEEEREPEVEILPETDPLLRKVRAALDMGFAGVILSGPPGTGKSWYAKRIAHTIAGDQDAVRVVQFHTSYQYEDFMLGFAPRDGGGFHLEKKTFALLCDDAAERPDVRHVLLIDEISRCDVARVFGEALTYVEMDKRGQEFTLASGSTMRVPPNLVILATMNPWDKGVDELDVALERRFAQIDVPPSNAALREILRKKGAAPDLIDRVVGFFEAIQKQDDEMVRLGHAYFINCVDEASARRAWEFRLLPFFRKACRLDRPMFDSITRSWATAFPTPAGTPAPEGGREGAGEAPPEPEGDGRAPAAEPA
jgi:5-methylcytosine-specific restriction protein B